MSERVTSDLLAQLLAATPEVEAAGPDAEPAALVAMLTAALPAREALLAELGSRERELDPAARSLVAEIRAREARWQEVLSQWRDRLGLSRAGQAKLRAYGQPAPR